MARLCLYAGILGLFFFALAAPLSVTYAQGVDLNSTSFKLVPDCPAGGCRACDLVKMASNVLEFILAMSVVIAVFIIVFTGIKYVTTGGSSHDLMDVASNIVVGIIIALCAWLIVDTFLKYLIGDQSFGMWNEISCVNNTIIQPPPNVPLVATNPVLPGSLPNASGAQVGQQNQSGQQGQQNQSGQQGQNQSGRPNASNGNLQQCPPSNTYCNVDALKAAGMTDQQANIMSCIALSESSGVPTAQIISENTNPCGLFQIQPGTWRDGVRAGGITGSCASYSSCTNASCNAQVAGALVQSRGYRDWTCPNCNSKAQQCINQYGGPVASLLIVL